MSSTTSGTVTAKIEPHNRKIFTVAFLQNADCDILTGCEEGAVLRWRISDCKQTGLYKASGGDVQCISVSNDGRWIVTGTRDGVVTVWGTEQHEKPVAEMKHNGHVLAVDISSDSRRVVSGSSHEPAAVWDIRAASGDKHLILNQSEHPVALKFSPDGRRIATAQHGHPIRIFDSVHGKELTQITAYHPPTVLEWTSDGQHIFAVTHGKIACFDTTTASLLSEHRAQPAQDEHHRGGRQIAFAGNHKIIAASAERAITFWDASTFARLGQADGAARSIAFSPDGLYLATIGEDNTIIIHSLREVVPQSSLDKPPPQLPFLRVSHAAFSPWTKNQLEIAEDQLTEEINRSAKQDVHYPFANRAFIQARREKWEDAKRDAEESLKCRISIGGLIAKSWALLGLKRRAEALEMFELASTLCDANENRILLLIKYVILCMTGSPQDSVKRLMTLAGFLNPKSVCLLVQAQMYHHLGLQYLKQKNYVEAICSFERACVPVSFAESPELRLVSLVSGWCFEDLRNVVQARLRDALSIIPRTQGSVGSLLLSHRPIPQSFEAISNNEWINTFMKRRVVVLEQMGDKAHSDKQLQEAISHYTAALYLSPRIDSDILLLKWTNAVVDDGLWKDAWNIAPEFGYLEYSIRRSICERLESSGHLLEATECFRNIEGDHATATWSLELKKRLIQRLEDRVSTNARISQSHRETTEFYSAALALQPDSLDFLVGRSEIQATVGMWNGAITDAEEAIKCHSLSPRGYQAKHAALLGAGRYSDAFEAYKTMCSQSSGQQPPQPHTNLSEIEAAIRAEIEHTTRNSPRVLINTITGRMRNKAQQEAAFAATPDFKALCASMVTGIDQTRIKKVVAKYYRYVMLSHTWERDEPRFQLVEKTTVYELQNTEENDKLRDFCALARDAGYVWAWSDTCCIDKQDQVGLQESLVSMFRWYHGSALTIVFLRDAGLGLECCRWISRGWTYQEYVAARVVRFYTGDWKPYLGLTRWNHKEAPEIRDAMESNVKGNTELKPFVHELQPGQVDIRKKLSLASTRTTTVVEDAAYSLLGIFSVSIPVIYGEGQSSALGRLLGHLLTATGDASILAWSGKSGNFNSCLPARISVFQDLPTSHLPKPLHESDLNDQVHKSKRKTNDYHNRVMELYDRLTNLPAPSFAANRMKLSCIMFQLESLSPPQAAGSNTHHYRGKNPVLGEVVIRTDNGLPSQDTLYLVYPWFNAVLLDRGFELDKLVRAMRLFARLRQPFGGLLLALTHRGYQRVAADAVIEAQVKQDTLMELGYLRENARTIDVL